MLATRFVLLILVTLAAEISYAADPDLLQDFCVGLNDSESGVYVNGKVCKNPKHVTADDFVFSGLEIARNTSNLLGSNLTEVFEEQLRGLNHEGVAMVKIELAPKGTNPPHSHPRASEIIFVLKGEIYVGFIGTNPTDATRPNKLYAKILHPGQVFMFPRGLIHFQYNVGKTDAVAYASLNSQNPGIVTIASSLFGSDPPVNPEMLARAFQLNLETVKYLQSLTWTRNN
ncbi:germin-like protein subfamily 1 member 13-like [Dorcoceras hygrometricum]|uniref:Germin-like protein n=1 Tax=Dorcoceras hygrometricum TaxID=472368 RepID=A0A2Z7AUN8_9LAMI|nr:germin-like protein subfamily 1 member 13-like [Dorcoceras hygrometricum]